MTAGAFLELENQSDDSVIVGPTFTGFLNRVAPEESRAALTGDAVQILRDAQVGAESVCGRTGLVVGRVQSGKTLSYESVIALARDNGFALVIVVSGISTPLLDQGVKRLRGDLTAADGHGWNFLVNAGSDPSHAAALRAVRENWHDPETPAILKKTTVCLLLKHHGRIDNFISACNDIDWSGLKVLIIDDEADQASLNTLHKRNKQSATYRQLVDLRSKFPHHAYLQYTATPQAPLLVTINDVLSPDFVKVIEPGKAYVGGSDYFASRSIEQVEVIAPEDLEMANDPHGPPPESLIASLRLFVLGGAHVLASGRPETRSMLVHPSRVTAPHASFVRWITSVVNLWKAALQDPSDTDPLRAQFESSWNSLERSDASITDFESCWRNLPFVLRNLQVVEMNSRETKTPVIDWDETKSYVLVGGQALDRGFTVEGLAVTYMPRGPGLWNADSIQQRARFFGYKRSFFGQCRVYLDPSLRDAFERYVEHERHMLSSLRSIERGTSTLRDWERQFYLDPSMKPTRQSVISIPTVRVNAGERWILDTTPVSDSDLGDEAIRQVDLLKSSVECVINEYGHQTSTISVARALEFLESIPSAGRSLHPSVRGLKLQLAGMSDDAAEEVRVLFMRPEEESFRTVTAAGQVQPFQGRNRSYPGDRAIFDDAFITMQVHTFGVCERKGVAPYASMVVPAVWIPERLAGGWLLEDQPT
jgi:hypothetical protein